MNFVPSTIDLKNELSCHYIHHNIENPVLLFLRFYSILRRNQLLNNQLLFRLIMQLLWFLFPQIQVLKVLFEERHSQSASTPNFSLHLHLNIKFFYITSYLSNIIYDFDLNITLLNYGLQQFLFYKTST